MDSLLDGNRKDRIKSYIKLANYLDGDFAEVGVYRGGSAEIIASAKGNTKSLYLFDTFEGMPEVNSKVDNYHRKNDFNDTSYSNVCEGLSAYSNVFVYKGIFPEENGNKIKDKKFSLVHIDVDIYKSYSDCLNFFYPLMVDGGIIILDDYYEVTCEGAKTATDEFFYDKPEKPIWRVGPQVCIIKQPVK
jgi:O-methyltransferase